MQRGWASRSRFVLALIALLAVATVGLRLARAQPSPPPSVGSVARPPPLPSAPATVFVERSPPPANLASSDPDEGESRKPQDKRKVYVGAYAFQLPEFDLARNIYLMDFWVWFRWQGDDFDPSKSFELLNAYEGWNVSRTPVYVDEAGNPKPTKLGNGWNYQCVRIDARFARQFDVSAYPFDEQILSIAFEDNDQTTDALEYVTDEGTNRIDPQLTVAGWRIDHITVGVFEHEYQTNWGDPLYKDHSKYAQFQYNIHIRRPVAGYLATTLLPIAVVMLITMIVYLIDPRYFEGRLVLAIMSLLSAVALQLTVQKDLPKTGHMVLLDDVYILSYLTIFVALLTSTYAVHLSDRGEPQRARRLDRTVLVASSVLFFGGTCVLVLIRA
ncbi:MAG: hypothetical protein U0414_42210 [Polyangiaceae bacterium]